MGQISRHSAAFFAGTVFTAAAGYLFKIYLARRLGPEALGIYALGMTITALMGLLNGPGLHQASVRFVATYVANGKSEHLRSFLIRSTGFLLATDIVLSSSVLVVGPWIAEHFYHTKALKPYLWLFALIMFFGALAAFFGQVLQGYKDVMNRTGIANFVGTPLVMSLTIILIAFGMGLWGYIFAQVVSGAVVLMLLLRMVWKLTPPPARRITGPLLPLEKEVLSFSTTVFGIGMLEFLLAQVDKVLIGFYINVREVGIYAVMTALVAFVPIALQSVNQIFTPMIADLHSRGDLALLGRLFQTLTKWVLAFTLPLATVLVVFAKPVVAMFGANFVEGWPVLVIGVLGQLVNCGTGSVGYLLLMSGNQRRLIKIQATMAIVMILINIIAIPRWGIIGAATATAVATIGTNLWSLREVRSALGVSPYNRGYLRIVPAAVAMVISTLLLRHVDSSGQLNGLFILRDTVCVYLLFIVIALAAGLDSDDRVVATAIWRRLRDNVQRTIVRP
jgi:O-antigen/teichoic acid export membrane protein